MAEPATRRSKTTNPFYVLVVAAGTAFVVTALGWLAAPMIQQKAKAAGQGGAGPGAGSLAMAAWLDRWAVPALTVEVVVLIAAGLLAMATDRWFSREAGRD